MKNDTDLPQSVTILEHVQKPTKQRFSETSYRFRIFLVTTGYLPYSIVWST